MRSGFLLHLSTVFVRSARARHYNELVKPRERRIAVIVIALLLAISGVLSVVHFPSRNPVAPTAGKKDTATSTAVKNLPVEPPPPITEHMKKVVAASAGFAVAISYTDNGFEPSDVEIKKGQSVRFTNNSTHAMWVMSSGGDGGVYPAGQDSCGQTAFDTCIALPAHDIWEFKFDVPGTWVYRNSAHKADVGVMRVK